MSAVHVGRFLGDVEPDRGGFVTLASPGSWPGEGVVAQRWLATGRPADGPLVLSRTANVNALFLAPGGRLAVVIVAPNPNAARGRVEVWNVAQRRVVKSVPLELPEGNEPVVSPNGNLIAMNVQTRAPSASFVPHYDLDVLNLATGRQRVLATETDVWGGLARLRLQPRQRAARGRHVLWHRRDGLGPDDGEARRREARPRRRRARLDRLGPGRAADGDRIVERHDRGESGSR